MFNYGQHFCFMFWQKPDYLEVEMQNYSLSLSCESFLKLNAKKISDWAHGAQSQFTLHAQVLCSQSDKSISAALNPFSWMNIKCKVQWSCSCLPVHPEHSLLSILTRCGYFHIQMVCATRSQTAWVSKLAVLWVGT